MIDVAWKVVVIDAAVGFSIVYIMTTSDRFAYKWKCSSTPMQHVDPYQNRFIEVFLYIKLACQCKPQKPRGKKQ